MGAVVSFCFDKSKEKGVNFFFLFSGSENKMKHHFHGYIAGLSVLLGENEKPEVLSCLHKCKETLEVPSVKLLEPGMELMTNSGKEITKLIF